MGVPDQYGCRTGSGPAEENARKRLHHADASGKELKERQLCTVQYRKDIDPDKQADNCYKRHFLRFLLARPYPAEAIMIPAPAITKGRVVVPVT